MKLLLVGSRAAQLWDKEFRRANDIDVWVDREGLIAFLEAVQSFTKSVYSKHQDHYRVNLITGETIELSIKPSMLELCNYTSRVHRLFGVIDVQVATPYMLYKIKWAHVVHPHIWHKTISDYHYFREKYGDEFGEVWGQWHTANEHLDMLPIFYDERARKDKSKAKLDMSNEKFFGKSARSLGRVFIHDDLHEAVKFYDTPIYTWLKLDQSKAMVNKGKFIQLSQEDKVKCVQEEAMSIALERYLIPQYLTERGLEKVDARIAEGAFRKAVERISTTLTKGWFREFAIENWPAVVSNVPDYVGLFNQALARGLVRKLGEDHE